MGKEEGGKIKFLGVGKGNDVCATLRIDKLQPGSYLLFAEVDFNDQTA